MHQLMYLSTATKSFVEEDLNEILQASRRNNTALDITGLLLFYHGSFLQILEGEEADVLKLYLKIMKDSRHRGCVTLFGKDTAERDFAEWSMGFKNLSAGEWNELGGFIDLQDQQSLMNGLKSKSMEVITMIKTFLLVNAR